MLFVWWKLLVTFTITLDCILPFLYSRHSSIKFWVMLSHIRHNCSVVVTNYTKSHRKTDRQWTLHGTSLLKHLPKETLFFLGLNVKCVLKNQQNVVILIILFESFDVLSLSFNLARQIINTNSTIFKRRNYSFPHSFQNAIGLLGWIFFKARR